MKVGEGKRGETGRAGGRGRRGEGDVRVERGRLRERRETGRREGRGRMSEGVAGERGGGADAYQGDGELWEEGGRERAREPGLGEILRGLRAMAWVKRARVVCECLCMCVHVRAHTHIRRACMYPACARVTSWAGVHALYVRARKFSARVRMRARARKIDPRRSTRANREHQLRTGNSGGPCVS